MDLLTIIGNAIAWVMIVGAIIAAGMPLKLFWDLPSFLLVLIGSLASCISTLKMETLRQIPKYFSKIFRKQFFNASEIINQLVGFAESARKEGLLSLDGAISEIDDQFLATGLKLVVDGTDPGIIKKILNLELDKMADRHATASAFFGNWAALAPSYGMLGTVQGLIGMLANLSDTSSIGRGMALALITTFYGSILANVVCTPISLKLATCHEDEMLAKLIIVEGILSIQAGDNPHILEQKLYAFLPPKERPIAQDI